MSLFAVINNAGSALMAQGRAIQTTANNVSNAETPGYARQRAELTPMGARRRQGVLMGQGVQASQVTAAYDRFAQGQVNQRLGEDGFARGLAADMRAIEVAVGEGEEGGIGAGLSAFFDSLSALEADPSSPALRLDVLSRAEAFSVSMNRAVQSVERQQSNANERITDLASRVSVLGAEIAAINEELVELEAGGQRAHDLRAQRTVRLEELAGLGPTRAETDPGGSLTVVFGGQTLVEKATSRQVVGQADPVTGDIQVRMSFGTTTFDISGTLDGSGELGAALQIRDQVAPALIDQLDTLAFEVATQFNAIHSAGFGLDGVTGRDFFTPPAVVAGAASALSLDPAVAGNPDAIQGASIAGTVPGGNGNLVAMGNLSSAQTMAGGTRSFSTFLGQTLSQVGSDAAAAYADETLAAAGLSAAQDLRDAVSGVSLEEEAVDLMRFQDAYQAAARVMATANELFDDLLSIL